MVNKIHKVALITGAARRVGAAIAKYLHAEGMNVVIHYHSSESAAQELAAQLNSIRQNSAVILKAELKNTEYLSIVASTAFNAWGRLDALVNNAASFAASPLMQLSRHHYDDLMRINLEAPLFLSQACAPYLKSSKGCIVNITDIHAAKPLKNHTVYCMSKAGMVMLTQSLAKELAPEIRVNAVAPGAVCWPEDSNNLTPVQKNNIINETLLKVHGTPEDIAKAVGFFIQNASYVTGQILKIDGGRHL